jgi:acetyl-CoA C-acetyltransferase
MTGCCIVGWGHTRFGRRSESSLEDLLRDAGTAALAHAQVEPADIDATFVGTFNGGLVRQEFPAGLVGLIHPDLRHTPATRLENACASGSAALHAGLHFLLSGAGKLALVIGVEKMSERPADEIGRLLLGGAYVQEESSASSGFAGVFGRIATQYFEAYGDQSEALAAIAAKNHSNGVDNPYAHLRKALAPGYCATASAENPVVAGPLKRTDCSPISDGAAAIVLVRTEYAAAFSSAVGIRSACQVNDLLPLGRRNALFFEGAAQAWGRSLAMAGLALDDLDFVETHDCFTIAELMQYEAMGLAPRGRGSRAALEGWTQRDGRLPVNPSGGLKSRGHPLGATGVSMHVMAAMQLSDQAGAMQLGSPGLAGVFNMGGVAVANYCSILERIR